MCLILLAYKEHPDYPFIFAANRDEFYERPSQAADFWKEQPDILGGLDLRDGGTWLGMTRSGRFAALTNFRDPVAVKTGAPSRGELVSRFLQVEASPGQYLSYLEDNKERFNGFSMIFGRIDELFYYCNRDRGGPLAPGIHGLSNALLDVPWPKVRRGKQEIAALLKREPAPRADSLFRVLADQSKPQDVDLPQTGIGLDWERLLSPLFITSPVYGTCSATVIVADRHGSVTFEERTFSGGPEHWTAARFNYSLPGRNHEQA